ncbi:MAG: hypothetical protein ACHQ0J_06870 [Candidatus Dormibacterales bacterium]
MPFRLRLLKQFLWVACAVMATCALNEVLVWMLFAFKASNPNYAFGLLAGAGPLVVVVFVAFTQPALSSPETFASGIRWVLWTTAIGFLPIVVGGVGTNLYVGPSVTSASDAHTYSMLVALKYTLIGAIAADAAAFALAWFTPTHLEAVPTS